jgi:hypothetical protein
LSVCKIYCQLYWFCFDHCNSIWGKGLLLFCFLNCFLCVCSLPMMWIHCWVYLHSYIPVMRISFLQLPFVFFSIHIYNPYGMYIFSYMEQYFIRLSEIQSFLTNYTLKIRFCFEIKSKGIRKKLKFSMTHDYYL